MDEAILKESVAFFEPTPASNGQGGTVMGWIQRYACRAKFRFLRAGEAVMQGRLEGRATVVVTIQSYALSRQIRTDWRMRDVRSGEDYNLRSIIPSDDGAWLDLTVESGVAV